MNLVISTSGFAFYNSSKRFAVSLVMELEHLNLTRRRDNPSRPRKAQRDTSAAPQMRVSAQLAYFVLANPSFTSFSYASSFLTLGRSCMRWKCSITLGKPERSTANWLARRQHQKKCASGAVKWSKKYSRPASKSSPIRKFSNIPSVANLITLSDAPVASQTLGGLLIRLR